MTEAKRKKIEKYLPLIVSTTFNVIAVVVTITVAIAKSNATFEEQFKSNAKEHQMILKEIERKVDRSEFNMYIRMSEKK